MKDINYFKDEIVIEHMTHEMYTAVVSYIESTPNHPGDRTKPLNINEIDEICAGSPPHYKGVHIGIESYAFPEAKKHASESIQGLAKILYGELSLPIGQRQKPKQLWENKKEREKLKK